MKYSPLAYHAIHNLAIQAAASVCEAIGGQFYTAPARWFHNWTPNYVKGVRG